MNQYSVTSSLNTSIILLFDKLVEDRHRFFYKYELHLDNELFSRNIKALRSSIDDRGSLYDTTQMDYIMGFPVTYVTNQGWDIMIKGFPANMGPTESIFICDTGTSETTP